MSSQADLPVEILLEIFLQYLPRTLDKEGRRAFQSIRTVSPKWRSISLASPVLWSSVSVTRRNDDPFCNRSYPRLLDGWISRAGPSVLLELEYEDFSVRHFEDKTVMESLIRRHQARWRRLSLSIESPCFMDIVPGLPSSNWLNLNTLALWFYDFVDQDPGQFTKALNALDNITSLRRLSIQDSAVYEGIRRYGPINLAELHIDLDETFDINYSNFISSYPSLTKLTLNIPPYHDMEIPPGFHLTLPCLSTFVYHSSGFTLLDHLTTAALVDLEIEIKQHRSDPENEILARFLTRCTSSLKSIALSSHPSESLMAQILPLFSIRQSVAKLTLDSWPPGFDRNTFPEDAENDWLPNLQELTVSIEWAGITERMESLAAYLQRRDIEFPYDLFEDVQVGKLRVMVSV
ncbi:hypothetical protein BKA70DRAFT_1334706 [Coprinopsis sp. MPI-PUGE-AT-0042]|nr:hypothetical protein BKA70DRAFT_1334706 [Coprinopsis sp. MPI-PUGE-AT-0042]